MKKFDLRIFVGILISALLIFWIYWTITGLINNRPIQIVIQEGLHFHNLYAHYFILPIPITFALIGYYIRNPFGWILIAELFYFIVLSFLLIFSTDGFELGFGFLLMVLSLSIIILINSKSIRNQYKIKFKSIIILNMISAILSLIFILIRGNLFVNNVQIFK
jgi:hypothetical protein